LGEIDLNGKLLAGRSVHVVPEAREVGLVFQEYVLFPHMTALANVAFGLKGADRRKRAIAALKDIGLGGLEQRYPHQLSGGQQQRVALARALARRPRAMLLDEPFASIDGVLRRRLREELRRILKASGAPTVMVTHDPEEALAIGDRIAIMKAGAIIETNSPQSLFQSPKTPEGASVFAGSQCVEGWCDQGVLRTAFGEASLVPCGVQKAIVVVLPGGVRLVQRDGAAAKVTSARFAGPGWAIEIAAETGERLWAPSPTPLQLATGCVAEFDPSRVKVFSA
jgi:iron(III) transport system ATP-binding protein